jgi:hypothetical protein
VKAFALSVFEGSPLLALYDDAAYRFIKAELASVIFCVNAEP